jgi:lysophospholipase L1-like esterase
LPNPDVLLLGDSLTDNWRIPGAAAWKAYFPQLTVDNFGIGFNQTSEVLHQLQSGELKGISPRVIVLQIGTNNVGIGQTADQVSQGIATIVQELRVQFPQSKVLLVGIFPRDPTPDALRATITQINASISSLADGRTVRFIDIGAAFLQPDGTISRAVLGDYVHPTPWGYQIWAAAMQQPLLQMLATASPPPAQTAAPALPLSPPAQPAPSHAGPVPDPGTPLPTSARGLSGKPSTSQATLLSVLALAGDPMLPSSASREAGMWSLGGGQVWGSADQALLAFWPPATGIWTGADSPS